MWELFMNKMKCAPLLLLAAVLFAPTAQGSSSQFYTIQISSPQKEKDAKSLVAKLKHQGLDAFESKIVVKGKKHFRVCTGYFDNLDLAKAARNNVVRETHRKDVIVQRLKGSALPDSMVLGNYN